MGGGVRFFIAGFFQEKELGGEGPEGICGEFGGGGG